MVNIKSAIYVIALIPLLAFLGYYFAAAPRITLMSDAALYTVPDIIASGVTVQQFDEYGILSQELHAPKLVHIPDGDTHWLTEPHMRLLKAHGVYWDITAARGKAVDQLRQITLTQNVRIVQAGDQNHPASLFKTDILYYYPKTKIAETHHRVFFEQAGSQVQSQGMRAWLDEDRIQLLGKAHAIYQKH